MLGVILLLTFPVATLAVTDRCPSNLTEHLKVRLSLKTALGSDAYTWNANEDYLFKSMVAFAMSNVETKNEYQASDVKICNITQRVSFIFVVTKQNGSIIIPRSEVESAIRKNRNRFNGAFLLSDQTLEFVEIPPTLSPTTGSSSTTWLIVFGVVLGVIVAGIIFLIVTGIKQRRRKNKQPEGREESEIRMETAMTMENGVLYETADFEGGQSNEAYVHDKDSFTPL